MAELERKYADRPVHFFHVTCGENPAQALDFKKHYRSDAVHLLDTDYRVSRAYRAGSWPTTVIVDADGRIAGRWRGVSEPKQWEAALRTLDASLARAKGGPPKGSYCIGGKCYVRSEATAWDGEPAMVRDAGGGLHLVFTRDRGGSGDLFHRVLEGDSWSDPQRVTTSSADDYSPALCADGDSIRLVWCSDRAASGKYDIWTKRWDGSAWSAAERVTETTDDAAHPRCAVDTQGNVWVTYYGWVPWGPHRSRDREVYVRHHDGKSWSAELQISPSDVPRYEDHADPAIAADAQGNVWVAWAWDTHPEEGSWPFAPTYGPAIFARQLRVGQPPSQLMMVGVRAQSLAAAKRSAHWGAAPEVHCRGDSPYFAFAAHVPHGEHSCAITRYELGEGFPAPQRLGINETFVGTPRLVAEPNGGLVALWSAKRGVHDALYLSRMKVDGSWTSETRIWEEANASLGMAVGTFDKDGKLWIAAVRTSPNRSEVVLEAVDGPGAKTH